MHREPPRSAYKVAVAADSPSAQAPGGVTAARMDWAMLHPDGADGHALTSERLTDTGAAVKFRWLPVEVEKGAENS